MPSVTLTGLGDPAAGDDQLLLPPGIVPPSSPYVLVRPATGKPAVMTAGTRGGDGTAARVNPTVLAGFGGEGATVAYEGIGHFRRFWKSWPLKLKALALLLVLAGTIATAVITFVTDTADATTGQKLAVASLAIGVVLALIDFVQGLSEL